MTDDLATQIGKLHEHISHVSHQIRDVQSGQDRLHKDHLELRERVDHLERVVSRDVQDLNSHVSEANIYRGHLLEGFGLLQKAIENLDIRFGKHAEAEEKDRKEVIKGQQTTIRSILLAAVTFVATGFVLLWQTGGLA